MFKLSSAHENCEQGFQYRQSFVIVQKCSDLQATARTLETLKHLPAKEWENVKTILFLKFQTKNKPGNLELPKYINNKLFINNHAIYMIIMKPILRKYHKKAVQMRS